MTTDNGFHIQTLMEGIPSKRQLHTQIDRLQVSADAKAFLCNLADVTIEVGGKIISAGRQILNFVFDLIKRFPNTTFGLVMGLVVSSLVSSVPLLGLLLGPLLGPLMVAFGLAAGAIADLENAPLRSRVADLERHYSTLIKNG